MKRKEKYYTEEQQEVKSFIKILIGLILILGLLYFLSAVVLDKGNKIKRTNNEGKVQYSNIYLGTLLNRADDEYYVLVFNSENITNHYIINKASDYQSSSKTALYTADLSLELNKGFLSDKSNYNVDSVKDLKFKGTTLVKIKGGKITKFIENELEIEKELS